MWWTIYFTTSSKRWSSWWRKITFLSTCTVPQIAKTRRHFRGLRSAISCLIVALGSRWKAATSSIQPSGWSHLSGWLDRLSARSSGERWFMFRHWKSFTLSFRWSATRFQTKCWALTLATRHRRRRHPRIGRNRNTSECLSVDTHVDGAFYRNFKIHLMAERILKLQPQFNVYNFLMWSCFLFGN